MSVHAPVATVKTLVLVWGTLVVLTAVTSEVATIELGPWNVVVALAIAVIKASLVVWVFMGVRYTTTLTKLFVVAGLVWLSIMIFITLSDYNSRNWTYHALPWSHSKTVGGAH